MTEQEQFEDIFCSIKQEGFHYCFNGYSSWRKVNDENFHELRINYLKAAEALEKYIKEKANKNE